MKQLKKLNIQTHILIVRLIFWLGILLAGIGCRISSQSRLHTVAWLGISAILLSNLWRILFIKCPHCGSGLYRSRGFYCPDCGKKFLK